MLSTYQHTNVNFKDPSSDCEDPNLKAIIATQINIHSLYWPTIAFRYHHYELCSSHIYPIPNLLTVVKGEPHSVQPTSLKWFFLLLLHFRIKMKRSLYFRDCFQQRFSIINPIIKLKKQDINISSYKLCNEDWKLNCCKLNSI